MQIPLNKYINKSSINRFFSYFFVGGLAAIVEWLSFAILVNIFAIHYITATCMSFVFSTSTNWLLGKIWAFRDSNRYAGKALQEILLIFLVSGCGLLFNIGLMYLFVKIIGLDSPLQKTLSKIVSTGIVFIWNYLIRIKLVYRR